MSPAVVPSGGDARDKAGRRVVVGAVVVRDGLVLAARRRPDVADPGRWEFPGGKVEPGETERRALTRELSEELGIAISTGELIIAVPITFRTVLHVWSAGLEPGSPEPAPTSGEPNSVGRGQHDELCWLAPAELSTLDWLPADAAALTAVAEFLARPIARPKPSVTAAVMPPMLGGAGFSMVTFPLPANKPATEQK